MFIGVIFFEGGRGCRGGRRRVSQSAAKYTTAIALLGVIPLKRINVGGTVEVPNFRQRLRKTCPPRIHLDESTLRRDSKSATVLVSWVGTPQ